MIKKKIPDATIGFFLHIPFPSFEIFRILPRPWREAIINGMLGADLVGFHTNDYTQHFIKCVKRTTGFECHENLIYTPDKLVKADAFPIGIDYDKFNTACLSKEVLIEKQETTNVNRKLYDAFSKLDERKQYIVKNRFLTDKQESLESIAQKFNVSRERIRQLETIALNEMKQYMEGQ